MDSRDATSLPDAHPVMPRPKRRRRGLKIFGIVALSFIVLVVGAGTILMATKPWAPTIVVTDAGPTGTRITEEGMLANWYPAEGTNGPAVLVFGGSDGGIGAFVDREAVALQEAGFSALAISYWGGPGQPESMEQLPLETFTTALDWLQQQPQVDKNRVAVMGASKGSEAALLLGARRSDIKAVVAQVPSSVVWPGINLREPWKMASIGSTWSEGGEPLEFVPYSTEGTTNFERFNLAIPTFPEHPNAEIPVEESSADLLLVCAQADELWPSCPMASQVEARAQARTSATVEVLELQGAGHLAIGPPYDDPAAEQADAELGGTVAANAAARQLGWDRTIAFLTESLG